MDDFNKVGRLSRPQFLPSTRGFGLDGIVKMLVLMKMKGDYQDPT